MTDRYAVIGNPIEHSRSPQIHAAFARQTGEDISYHRILGDLEDFEGDVELFVESGGRGLNVTVPFKERAFRLADTLSESAELAGAVNTLIVTDDGLEHLKPLTALGELRIYKSQVTKRGIDELRQALPQCTIKCPDVDGG